MLRESGYFVRLFAILGGVYVLQDFITESINLLEKNPLVYLSLLLLNMAIFYFVIKRAINMGILRSSIRFSRSQHGEVSDIVRGLPRLKTYIVANILYTFIMWWGMILLFVPGAIWAIKYGFMNYLLVDTEMGIRQAFRKSAEMTKGHKVHLFWWGTILITMMSVAILPCFIGMKFFFGTWYNFTLLTAWQRAVIFPLGLGWAFVYPVVVSGKGYVYNKFYERFVK